MNLIVDKYKIEALYTWLIICIIILLHAYSMIVVGVIDFSNIFFLILGFMLGLLFFVRRKVATKLASIIGFLFGFVLFLGAFAPPEGNEKPKVILYFLFIFGIFLIIVGAAAFSAAWNNNKSKAW